MNLTVADSYGPKHLQLENGEYGFSFSNEGTIYCFKTKQLDEKNSWFDNLRETLSH